jgi:formate dehydrogenase
MSAIDRSSQPLAVPLASMDEVRGRIRSKSKLKGRQADHASREEVQALIGPGPHRRDLLIEHLHRLNDAWHGLRDRHLVA